jgi:hypothetical protein
MAAKTFWQWYDKELPSGDDALNFQAAWDAAIESVEENSNNLQQLKAEIAAYIIEYGQVSKGNPGLAIDMLISRLRQLSAV